MDKAPLIKSNNIRIATIVILFVWLFMVSPNRALSSVELLYFTATAMSNYIFLEWETAQEINHVGFYIQRSQYPISAYERIGSFIPANDDPFIGGYYSYRDDTAIAEILYSYRLEIIDASGKSEFSETVDAIIQLPTPTSTVTSTSTITPTSGPSPTITRTPKDTKTPTMTPTNTRTPTPYPSATKVFTVTPTRPTLTPTNTATFTPLPTTTLDSLSAITQAFPLATSTATMLATPVITLATSPIVEFTEASPLPGRVYILAVIVILLWLILAGFLIFYLRRLDRKK